MNNELVSARPPSGLYRLQKSVQRNKAAFTAAAAIAVVLVIGVVVSTSQAIRANRAEQEQIQLRKQAQKAEALAQADEKKAKTEAVKSEQTAQFLKDMLKGAGPSVARGRDATLLREILDKTAQRVGKDLTNQPEVQGDLWFTLGSTYAGIGDYPTALKNFQQAVESYRLVFNGPHAKLALALANYGRNQSHGGNVTAGKTNALLAVEMARKAGDPQTLATCLIQASASFDQWFITTESTPLLSEALALRQQSTNDPAALADCLRLLGGSLQDTNSAKAEELICAALALHRQSIEPDDPRIAEDLFSLGQALLAEGKVDEAVPVLRETAGMYKMIYDQKDPYRPISMWVLGQALVAQGKRAEVESLFSQSANTLSSNGAYHHFAALLAAFRGEWKPAADHLLRDLELQPDDGACVCMLLPVLVLAERNDEFQKCRHEFLESPLDIRDPNDRVNLASGLLLLPIGDADVERACQYSDAIADALDGKQIWSKEGIKALVEYRRGHINSAGDWSNKVVSRGDTWAPRTASGWYIQAMTCARLQQMDSARAALARGDEEVRQYDLADVSGDSVNLINARALGREARKTIENQPVPTK